MTSLVTDTTFDELRAALHALDNLRPEGQRGIAACLSQLKRDVRQVKVAFARRLEQIQSRTMPRIVSVVSGPDPDAERFQSLLFEAQSERDREREQMSLYAAILQRHMSRVVKKRSAVVMLPRTVTEMSDADMLMAKHYRQLQADMELNEQAKRDSIAALQRYWERDDTQLRYIREQRGLMIALRDVATDAVARSQAAEHRVRRLQSNIGTLQAQLDERDDADDELQSMRGRVRDLERSLQQSERRLGEERRETDQLRRAQVRSEHLWLERLESLRAELDQEQSLWIERREGEYDRRFEDMRQQQKEAEAQLERAHASELQQSREQHELFVAEAEQRAADLETKVRDLQHQCDPRTLQEALDRCLRDCETKFMSERQAWSEERARSLSEHERMRTGLAELRGQLNRAKADEAELRAKFASAVDALEAHKVDAQQRLAEAVCAVREAERELFQVQVQRCERDHCAIVDELNARLAQLQNESLQAREQMAESVRRLEADLQSSRALHERTMTQLDRALADAADAQQRYERDLHAAQVEVETDLEKVRAQCRAACLQSQTDAEKAVVEAEARAKKVLEQRLSELRSSLLTASEDATRAVTQMAQDQLERAREVHEAELRQLRERHATDTTELLQSERATAQGELYAVTEQIETLKSEFQSERERILADCRAQYAVLERERNTLQLQLDSRQVELAQAHAERDRAQRDHERALTEAEQHARTRLADFERRNRDLSEVIEQQGHALDRERSRGARKLRKLQEKLEAVHGEKDARTEDRERIRELEVEASRTESAAEQLANEIRFYKLELQNRDQGLAGKYCPATSGGGAVAARRTPGPPPVTQVLRSASVVDVNSQAGFRTGGSGPVRPRRVSPLPRT